jgi:hypothetical protein
MENIDTIKENINKLEEEALKIEAEIIRFFDLIEIIPLKRETENPFSYSHFDPLEIELWKELKGEIADSHRSLVIHYETWHNHSHILIQNYYPNKETEFVEYHDGKKEIRQYIDVWHTNKVLTNKVHVFYGISELLQLNEIIRRQYKPRNALQEVTGLFLKQRGIILALPDVLQFIGNKDRENTLDSSQAQDIKSPSISAPHSIINVGSETKTQLINSSRTTINIQNFNQVSEIVSESISDERDKQKLLAHIKKMEAIQGKPEYLKMYQDFFAIAADHITVLTPIIPFLTQFLPK